MKKTNRHGLNWYHDMTIKKKTVTATLKEKLHTAEYVEAELRGQVTSLQGLYKSMAESLQRERQAYADLKSHQGCWFCRFRNWSSDLLWP